MPPPSAPWRATTFWSCPRKCRGWRRPTAFTGTSPGRISRRQCARRRSARTGRWTSRACWRFAVKTPPSQGRGELSGPRTSISTAWCRFRRTAPSATDAAHFTDTRSGESLGLFVLNPAAWQDHEYAIWASRHTLAVTFRYEHGVLHWTWPLITGTRTTGLTLFGHSAAAHQNGNTMSHERFLENRYGFISLNRVKDWTLEYPDERTAYAAGHPGKQRAGQKRGGVLEGAVDQSPAGCRHAQSGASGDHARDEPLGRPRL